MGRCCSPHHEHSKPSTKVPINASGWRSSVMMSMARARPAAGSAERNLEEAGQLGGSWLHSRFASNRGGHGHDGNCVAAAKICACGELKLSHQSERRRSPQRPMMRRVTWRCVRLAYPADISRRLGRCLVRSISIRRRAQPHAVCSGATVLTDFRHNLF